jgi:hypothetical protein
MKEFGENFSGVIPRPERLRTAKNRLDMRADSSGL